MTSKMTHCKCGRGEIKVDGNWFDGNIPGKLMEEHWPFLQSLDLYDNNSTGSVPEDLADMPELDFIQLQGNHLR